MVTSVPTVWSLRGVGAFEKARGTARPVRRGSFVVHVNRTGLDHPVVLGLIVSRSVGNAVVRNRTRRQIKAIVREISPQLRGSEVVVRALPHVIEHSFDSLRQNLRHCLIDR